MYGMRDIDYAYKKAIQTSELEHLNKNVPNHSLKLWCVLVFPVWLGLWCVLL